MELEAVIGLEIHVELKTNSKMFSSAPVSFGDTPNTKAGIYDMAFPGALPLPNKKAVVYAIRVCNALHMDIDRTLIFDRKNYFYSDLPKGYQITQHYRPIGRDGYLNINIDGKDKKIAIERLQIEEDACKQTHIGNNTFIDYNRAGIPLLEIVSSPEIKNGLEAVKYVEKIRSIVTFLDVSDGKMEEGSLRCDVNVSVKEKGKDGFGTKVEIKNVSTLTNIQRTIDFEIERQSRILSSGQIVKQETRRYDENKRQTELMRVKTDDVDYKYFTDPNIPPIVLEDGFIIDAINSSPKLAEERMKFYQELGVNDYALAIIFANKDMADYYDISTKSGACTKIIANWLIGEVQSYLNKNNISIKEFKVSPLNLGRLILLVENNVISNKQAKAVFDKMVIDNQEPEVIIKELGLTNISDEDALKKMINELLDDNKELVIEYKNGKNKVLDFFVGQIMKKTKGNANPMLTSRLLIQEINRR